MVGGWVSGLPFARRRKKRLVLMIYMMGSVALTVFSLSCIGVINKSLSVRCSPCLYRTSQTPSSLLLPSYLHMIPHLLEIEALTYV
jgi:hypothetical protein